MAMDNRETAGVVSALRQSSKGQLKYDRSWQEQGRLQEVLDEITAQLTQLRISPKALEVVKCPEISVSNNNHNNEVKEEIVNQKSPESMKHEQKTKTDDSHYLKHLSETELPIVEYETERLKSVQQVYDSKQEEFEKFTSVLHKQAEQQYHIIKQKKELETLQKNVELQRREQSYLKQFEENHRKSSEQAEFEAAREAELQAARENLLRKEKEQQELKQRFSDLHRCLLFDMIPKIEEKVKFCEQQNFTDLPFAEWKHLTTHFLQTFEAIAGEGATTTVATLEDLAKCQSVLKQAEKLLQDVSAATVHKQAEREQEKKTSLTTSVSSAGTGKSVDSESVQENRDQVTENSRTDQTVVLQSQKSSVKCIHSSHSSEVDEMEDEAGLNYNEQEEHKVKDNKNTESQFIDPSAFHDYCSIVKNVKNVNSLLEPFRTDSKQKKYRLELHKAVAINTISDASGSQLREKIRHLTNLLSGQRVEVGGKYTSCKEHPLAQIYCKNLLAEKLVMQGEEQVASKISAAFPFAVVAVTICSKFPDMHQLIMGHFYMHCPYLVPYYPLKEENQSDEDYFVSLGYKLTNGKLEEKTLFLKRMHGYMTLYAAMIQSSSAPGYPSQQFFTLEHGWRWIASILNIDPRPDITATVVLVFLEVAGHILFKTYDKQFKKILYTLCKDYFPKIKQVTPASSGGPVGRLREFLQSAIKKAFISQPEGLLSANFWRT